MPVKRKPRRKKAAPRSKGLTPAECRLEDTGVIKPLIDKIDHDGGALLACFKEPLGGQPTVLAVLPIDKVEPTPFQRDLSETHAKRMVDTIGKIGRYLDPIIAVPHDAGYWTPNGRHRLEALIRLGAKSVTALVLPDQEIQYKILALNLEKAHNLREKSLEVIRMYRALAQREEKPETEFVLEFEEPAFCTLGICYEANGRFGGGAYHSILKRADGWLEEPLKKSLKTREERAAKLQKLDARVSEIVKALEAKGFKSPYLKAFVVARVNPLRFMKTVPPFDEAIDDILKRATRFGIDKIKQEDIVRTGGSLEE